MPPLFFQDKGSGPPLVFLHGFCDSHQYWKDFIAPLIPSYRVLTLDLPGFGQSELLPAPFTLDQVGDAIAQLLQDCHIDKPIVIGHSLGGYVALSLMARNPMLLSGIGLIHSTPYADSEERKKVREKVIEFVKKNGVNPFLATFVPGLFENKSSPHVSAALRRASSTSEHALIAYSEAMRDRPDRSKMLANCSIPFLLIAGTHDLLIPIKDLRELAKMSKKCLFYELPKAAHMGIFEAKKRCQTIISKFAAKVFSL